MTSQVIIASYRNDFQWLIHCLGSLKRFASGFLHPVICVETSDVAGCRAIINQAYPECTIAVKEGRPSQGMMRAQLSMCNGDILCPDADFVFLMGSDSFAAGTYSPAPFFHSDGLPLMLYSTYRDLNSPGHSNALPWRAGTETILGWEPESEYMRRLPLVYPRGVFAPFRKFISERHRQPFEDVFYGMDKKRVQVSESNLIGAWAWKFSRDSYHWVDTKTCTAVAGELVEWPSPVRQFWSHGGLDRVTEANFVFGNGKSSKGRTPRQILDEILYNIPA